MKRLLIWLAPLALSVAFLGAAQASSVLRATSTPPPPPPLPVPRSGASAPAATPTPAVPATPAARPKATPSPAPPASEPGRVGLSGVWEVQIQRESETTYAHFKLTEKGGVLSGVYMDPKGKQFPLAGSVDVKTVHLVVSMPDGSTVTFEGTQDNDTDMLGLMTAAKENVAFTAAYRPKEKFIDNITPGAGGLGGLGGGQGPR